jgi:hypothetical protein
LELKIILCPFFCQVTTYDMGLDYTCIYHIKL